MSDSQTRLTAALADRYTVERELGQGGMAMVYVALDLKHQRRVAIKVLKPELAAALGPDRFLHEIEIAARLTHPNILTLIDSGDADGLLYYVMPYVEGQSLRERLAQGGELPVADVTRILDDVVDALAYAHGQGVVHRDIKPENVMLDGRHAMVMDFGIAKAVSDAADRETITSTGMALGTPTYMAPEQATADPNLDHRADIYALGVLGYELLTGETPFAGRSGQEILAAHLTEAPRAVSDSRPNTPEPLALLVSKALEKRPADRWQTAGEMLDQLELSRTSSHGVSPVNVTEPGRSRWGVALVAVLSIGAIAWVLWSFSRDTGTGSDKRIAVLAFDNTGLEEDAYFSDGIARDLSTQLAKLGSFEVVAHGAASQYSGAVTAYDIIGRTLEANFLVEGSVRRAGDAVRLTVSLINPEDATEIWSERFDRVLTAEEYFAIQSEIVSQIAEALELAVTPDERAALGQRPTEDIEAYNAYLKGRYHFSLFTDLADDRLAGQYLLHAIARDSGFALAYSALGDLLAARGAVVGQESSPIAELRGVEATDRGWPTPASFEAARRLALKALLLDSTLAEPHTTLGAVHMWYDWVWPAAGREFERAVSLDPEFAQGHQWYAEWLMAMNLPDSAVAEAKRATELDPGSPVIQWSHVRTLRLARRFEDVKQAALALDESVRDPLMATELAHTYLATGPTDSAAVWLLEAARRFGVPEPLVAQQASMYDSLGITAFTAMLPPDPMALSDDAFATLFEPVPQQYATFGEYDLALSMLERSHRLRLFTKTIPDLVLSSDLDPIRLDPRFKALLADMNLPDITEADGWVAISIAE